MTVKLSIRWIQSNSFKFKAGFFAKHWTYQIINRCVNASVVILPIEKYKLRNQAYSVCRRCWCTRPFGQSLFLLYLLLHKEYVPYKEALLAGCCWCQVLRREKLGREARNDRQTVHGNNSIKYKITFVGERTTYLTLKEWVKIPKFWFCRMKNKI